MQTNQPLLGSSVAWPLTWLAQLRNITRRHHFQLGSWWQFYCSCSLADGSIGSPGFTWVHLVQLSIGCVGRTGRFNALHSWEIVEKRWLISFFVFHFGVCFLLEHGHGDYISPGTTFLLSAKSPVTWKSLDSFNCRLMAADRRCPRRKVPPLHPRDRPEPMLIPSRYSWQVFT